MADCINGGRVHRGCRGRCKGDALAVRLSTPEALGRASARPLWKMGGLQAKGSRVVNGEIGEDGLSGSIDGV